MEDGVRGAQEEEEAEEQAQKQQHLSLYRRVDEGGFAALQTRSHIEAQAAAIYGMEQARVMGQELLQAKAQNAELKAEIKSKDAAHQAAKDAALEATDAILQATIQGSDAALQTKNDLIHVKDALLQVKDAEIFRLEAELARRDVVPAVYVVALPVPARDAAPAPPAPAALSQQQLQVPHVAVHHSHFLSFRLSNCPPPLPFRRKRVLQKRSVCVPQEILQLLRSNWRTLLATGICRRAQTWLTCSCGAEKALRKIARERLSWRRRARSWAATTAKA